MIAGRIELLRLHGARAVPNASALRRIAAGTLASAVGNGAWYSSWAIFLTRSIGLSPADVGVGMTIAGVLGVGAATPVGRLADRLGARETFLVLLVIQALACGAYGLVRGMATFVAVAAVAQIAGSSTGGPRNAVVLAIAPETQRLEVLGLLRAISHVGWAVGAVIGAVVISVDTRPAYLAMLALNGGSYLIYAGLVAAVARIPASPPSSGATRPRALRDRPYVTLAALMGILALCWAMLSTGLPLWVTLHTRAPRAISAVIVVLSSLAIAALQVPTNRRFPTPRAAGRGAVLAGAALAASCMMFAMTEGLGGGPAIALMLLAAGLHIAGELMFVAASWGLSVPLMPAGSPAEYQGVFATGEAAALMAAPALMTTLVADWGRPGWLALAAIFLIPAAGAIPATNWALGSRRRATADGQ